MTAVMERTEEASNVAHLHSMQGEVVPMLRDLALFTAHKKSQLVSIQHVRLHVEDGKLHGWATDRFVMGHAVSIEVQGELPHPVYVHYETAKKIAKDFAKAPVVWINQDADSGDTTFTDGLDSITVQYPKDMPEFPKMERLVEEYPMEGTVDPIGFDAAKLEKIAKVGKSRGATVAMQTGPSTGKPTHWQVGENFRALVMPFRLQDNEPVWLANK